MNVLIAGDFCPHNRVAKCFELKDYSVVLRELREITKSHDYSLVNFECPIVDSVDKECAPIIKQGPNLCCKPTAADAIKYAGFNCVTLANNHFRDYGDYGCKSTIDVCHSLDIETIGGGRNLDEAQQVLYKSIGGKKIAFINCCEHEFSIATKNQAGSAPLELIDLYHIITNAKSNADIIMVITHGGREYTQYPSPRLQKTYRWLIDVGADVVINHHQHCYSGYELYKSKPIFYGLGNLCFDEDRVMSDIWYEGYMVSFRFQNDISFELIPYIQCKEDPTIHIMNKDKRTSFFFNIERINGIISDPQLLYKEFESFSKTKFLTIDSVLSPYSSRLGLGLFKRGLLPSFISKQKLIHLQNIVECEARRDELELYFKLNINE